MNRGGGGGGGGGGGSGSGGEEPKMNLSPLAEFLVRRARECAPPYALANFLYWFLLVEAESDPVHGATYSTVLQHFLDTLPKPITRVLDVPGNPGSEPFSAEVYGLLLLCSMVLLLIAAVALTAMQIARPQGRRQWVQLLRRQRVVTIHLRMAVLTRSPTPTDMQTTAAA